MNRKDCPVQPLRDFVRWRKLGQLRRALDVAKKLFKQFRLSRAVDAVSKVVAKSVEEADRPPKPSTVRIAVQGHYHRELLREGKARLVQLACIREILCQVLFEQALNQEMSLEHKKLRILRWRKIASESLQALEVVAGCNPKNHVAPREP